MPPMPFPMPLLVITAVINIGTFNAFENLLNFFTWRSIWVTFRASTLCMCNYHKRPSQNFSLQYQYNILQTSDENEEIYQEEDN